MVDSRATTGAPAARAARTSGWMSSRSVSGHAGKPTRGVAAAPSGQPELGAAATQGLTRGSMAGHGGTAQRRVQVPDGATAGADAARTETRRRRHRQHRSCRPSGRRVAAATSSWRVAPSLAPQARDSPRRRPSPRPGRPARAARPRRGGRPGRSSAAASSRLANSTSGPSVARPCAGSSYAERAAADPARTGRC